MRSVVALAALLGFLRTQAQHESQMTFGKLLRISANEVVVGDSSSSNRFRIDGRTKYFVAEREKHGWSTMAGFKAVCVVYTDSAALRIYDGRHVLWEKAPDRKSVV